MTVTPRRNIGTREERLERAKVRALRFVDRGSLLSALAAVSCDLRLGHERLYPAEVLNTRLVEGISLVILKDEAGVRQWIARFV